MKKIIIHIFVILFTFNISAQSEFHVFPKNHKSNPGKLSGNGTLQAPWDLQTALNNKSNKVKAGDFIFLHEGVYNGRYVSNIKSDSEKIIISAYKNNKVILNGNVKSTKTAVLKVNGANIVFENFEITFKGTFSRNSKTENFKSVSGINHLDGENCHFNNLKIYNVPGIGIGSWKRTGGTKITNCIIFNTGFVGKQRGHGVGIYVQNQSDKVRLIRDNTIFNNYYNYNTGIFHIADKKTYSNNFLKEKLKINSLITIKIHKRHFKFLLKLSKWLKINFIEHKINEIYYKLFLQ